MSSFGIFIAALAIGLTLPQSADLQPPPRVIQQSAFTVIGISTRTSNAKEISGQGDIGQLWARFMQDGLLAKIPHKIDANILAVYTDYETDANGPYAYILGARVSSADNVPQGMVARKVPAGKYAVFTSGKGPAEKVVPDTWRRIWAVPKSSPGGNRTYLADFELYDQRATDPRNSQVDIYIGIK
jgi:predicted transcriptional regulator YdeE